jgi:ATP-binding cassette subfamily F protein uup
MGSVIVVTHDRAFLDGVATSILAFEPDPAGGPARVTRYAGGWQDYVLQKRRAEIEASRPARPTTPSAPPPKGKTKSGLTYAERLELDGILERIDAAELAAVRVEKKLTDPDLYATRGGEVAGLQAQLAHAKAEAAKLVKRWEELEMKKA